MRDHRGTYTLGSKKNGTPNALAQLAASPFRRLITCVRGTESYSYQCRHIVGLDRLISLRSLDLLIGHDFFLGDSEILLKDMSSLLVLPPQLEEVRLTIRYGEWANTDVMQTSLRGWQERAWWQEFFVGRLATLKELRRLHLDLDTQARPVSLEPLVACINLRSLVLIGGSPSMNTHAERSPFTGMDFLPPQIRDLRIGAASRNCTPWWLEKLAARSAAGSSLERVDVWSKRLTSKHLLALAAFPALTELHPAFIQTPCLPLLSKCTNLKRLLIDVTHVQRPTPFEMVLPHVLACSKLERLQLCCMQVRPAHLRALIDGLPCLKELVFYQSFLVADDGTPLPQLGTVAGHHHQPKLGPVRDAQLAALALMDAHPERTISVRVTHTKHPGALSITIPSA